MGVLSVGWGDPLEEGMATHVHRVTKVRTQLELCMHTHIRDRWSLFSTDF